MPSLLLSLLAIYGFVLLGVLAKRIFGEAISERTLTLVSLYFLQPILAFWGILQRPLDWQFVLAPAFFTAVIFVAFLLMSVIARFVHRDVKERSIFSIAGTLGNTGSLGITTGLVLLGPASVPYTSMMNLVHMFYGLTIGAYTYSRGKYSVGESFRNMLRLPLLWAALLALCLNAFHIMPSAEFMDLLEMGAHASIVIQLFLFGTYLSGTVIRHIHWRRVLPLVSMKNLLLPLAGMALLPFLPFPPLVAAAILLELAVPMAINNINLSSLYHCKPKEVTEAVFVSSLVFIGLLPVASLLLL